MDQSKLETLLISASDYNEQFRESLKICNQTAIDTNLYTKFFGVNSHQLSQSQATIKEGTKSINIESHKYKWALLMAKMAKIVIQECNGMDEDNNEQDSLQPDPVLKREFEMTYGTCPTVVPSEVENFITTQNLANYNALVGWFNTANEHYRNCRFGRK